MLEKVSCFLRIPYEILTYILIETDYKTVIRFAQINREWYHIILTDNTLWKHIYMSIYRIIDVEKGWLETFIHKLQFPQSHLLKGKISPNEDMNTLWNNINWRLALEHRIRTENNWRRHRPVHIIEDVNLSVDTEFTYGTFESEVKRIYRENFDISSCLLKTDTNGLFLEDKHHYLAVIHASDLGKIRFIRRPYDELDNDDANDTGKSIHHIRRIVNYSIINGQYIQIVEKDKQHTGQVICRYSLQGREPCLYTSVPQDMDVEKPGRFWNICTPRYTWLDNDVIWLQHVHSKHMFAFKFDSDMQYIIQSQTPHTVSILLLKDRSKQALPLLWELHSVTFIVNNGLLVRKLCAKGVLKDFVMGLIGHECIDERSLILSGLLAESRFTIGADTYLKSYKMCVIKRNTNVNHDVIRANSSTTNATSIDMDGSLILQIVWSRNMYTCYTFSDLGYVLGSVAPTVWCLFKMNSGECVQMYELAVNRIYRRIIGTLAVARSERYFYLVDILAGKILYELSDGFLRGVGYAHLVYDCDDENRLFHIVDFNSLSTLDR